MVLGLGHRRSSVPKLRSSFLGLLGSSSLREAALSRPLAVVPFLFLGDLVRDKPAPSVCSRPMSGLAHSEWAQTSPCPLLQVSGLGPECVLSGHSGQARDSRNQGK